MQDFGTTHDRIKMIYHFTKKVYPNEYSIIKISNIGKPVKLLIMEYLLGNDFWIIYDELVDINFKLKSYNLQVFYFVKDFYIILRYNIMFYNIYPFKATGYNVNEIFMKQKENAYEYMQIKELIDKVENNDKYMNYLANNIKEEHKYKCIREKHLNVLLGREMTGTYVDYVHTANEILEKYK